MELNSYIDHTLLKPEATAIQIEILCNEAKRYHFATVCVHPCWVSLCQQLLRGSGVGVCTVIGFPLGANTTSVKVYEASDAVHNGATELDMVLNIGQLVQGDTDGVTADVAAVVAAADGCTVKVILETCLLTDEQVVLACECCVAAGAKFVKTSTGFSQAGANPEVVALMVATVAGRCAVKAAGGVRTLADAQAMIAAGAARIGTSAGVALMQNHSTASESHY